ncbi:uncharacterized protein LOC125842978 [Solanum stenotomum]|uniref:uncharacterized protein LOC125842978 n=1 Tax=Solanum stenotomum TaxID=172797 RepID=UPI0020D0FA48|nr:uncharacterized protein LOC125842978 [Solanum stenotomum]
MIEGDSLYVENVIGDGNQFTVFGAGVTAYVDLLEKSCSCRKYELIKIPCAHAMAVLRSKHGNKYGMSIYEYSSPLYKVEAYLLAYMDSINVVPLESEWCVPEELLSVKILPPLVDTKLGRKRRKCVKGIDKNFKRRNKCSICKRIGHKRTTCVNNNKSRLENESSMSRPSNFQGVAKFEILTKLREFEENRDLLMTFLKEVEEERNHLKVLLKDAEIDRDQLKEMLILEEEKEKGLKAILCGLFLVFAFWKCVTNV